MLWESKEWELNVQTAHLFKNLYSPYIAIPLLNSAENILTADRILNDDDYEVEEEDINEEIELGKEYTGNTWDSLLTEANSYLKYDVHRGKTRAYYYVIEDMQKKKDNVDNHLINTLVKQEMRNYKRNKSKQYCFRKVFRDDDLKTTLCFVYNCADWLKSNP